MSARLRVAAVQMTSGPDVSANHAAIERLADAAAAAGCALVAFPETVSVRGRAAVGDEAIPGPTTDLFARKAVQHELWILGGSIRERAPEAGERVFNTSVLVAPDGAIAARYRKLHLFDVDITGGPRAKESERFAPGDDVVTATIDGTVAGLTVCYDLRFPELYRRLALAGAEVLFVPSAFATETGRAHWEPLLRARAIEDQAYVIAPAQVGHVGDAMDCYGHAMIVDPWGRILGEARDGDELVIADLDLDELRRIRRELPALASRRPDVYGDLERPAVAARRI